VSDRPWDDRLTIRRAAEWDVDWVAGLARELAQSFTLSRERFLAAYPALLADDGACLLVAVRGRERLGYLLGFRHLTFYANGPVAWVEEVCVRGQEHGRGIGRALMSAFEQWATAQGCGLIAVATRRAAPFYRALDYQESAVYFRKVLEGQASELARSAAKRILAPSADRRLHTARPVTRSHANERIMFGRADQCLVNLKSIAATSCTQK